MRAARVLDHKLANWSGGRRYTCPSLRGHAGCRTVSRIAVPGFQPFAVYDVLLANLVPGVDRREAPRRRDEVLGGRARRWPPRRSPSCATSTQPDARERLGRVAIEEHVGADGFWSLTA